MFCYVNSVFAPGLDEGVGALWKVSCFFFGGRVGFWVGLGGRHVERCIQLLGEDEEIIVGCEIILADGLGSASRRMTS